MSRRAPPPTRAGRSPLGRMERHLRCLYVHDPEGRIRTNREPAQPAAPRLHLGRTPQGNLWRFRDDLPSALVRDLSRLCGKEKGLAPDWSGQRPPPPERIAALQRLLLEDGGAGSQWRGPAFSFPSQPATAAAAAGVCTGEPALRALGPEDRTLLERHFEDAIAELAWRRPCFALVADRHAISLCLCARSPDACPDSSGAPRAAEAGVETAPEYRGRGYALRTLSAWARAVRASGLEPLYSTAWENRASRAVARKLGLIAYGEDFCIH